MQTLPLRQQPARAFAFRFAHDLPVGNGLDLAGASFAIGAVSARLGFLENPLAKLRIA